MSETPNRLPGDAPHGLGGSAIDRSRRISFRLNSRQIEGFAGDSVLSAALADGIQIAGRHGDEPIALDETFAPLVSTGKGAALPMERTPALDGVDFVTIGDRRDPIASGGLLGTVRHLLVGPARTLNHRFGDATAIAAPWHNASPTETIEADFAIVGGGIAGLSAAAAASAAGKSAVLVERTDTLGGITRYFGGIDGEASPDETITELLAGLEGKTPVTVLLRAEAFAIAGTTLRVHQVVVDGDRPTSRVVAIVARHIVIATGAMERLPVFPGNRTPGIAGALAAYMRAERYGVWPGRRALFTTPQSFAYRLALHAADAGVAVQRIVDSRLAPLSRFVDFAKAMGITLASALAPSHAEPLERNKPGLRVSFSVNMDEISHDASAIETDQLIAAGAWQPDIMLWLRAGGAAAWDETNGWLAPRGSVATLSLAGSAAGLRTNAAALASGKAAILTQLGKSAPRVVDHVIEEAFETPDAHTSVAPFRPHAKGNTYLDRGASLITRRSAETSRHGISGIAVRPVQLSLGDIAAAVDIGSMAARDAGSVAAERCALAGEITDTGWRVHPPAPATAEVPAPPVWLTGRFGDKPQVWAIASADARNFGPGCLVFTNSETSDPLKAIGIIYAAPLPGTHGGIAIMAGTPDNASLFVRDAGTAVASRLTGQLKLKS
ncbi:FAD-dependent oxidoreductase [Devosia sp. ZB163]|uniref:FAD-dependent oxidoreductase n=1 Tax=Devosia sp. ZB163 TaxID=3025938 RepID=UPI00235FCF30|nr:FAD-dependent oxidoreductase [Devosia sp. ZB163]MDC9823842.1 FAD-dependent oxidoreductase [Devosia sp. ZB163]